MRPFGEADNIISLTLSIGMRHFGEAQSKVIRACAQSGQYHIIVKSRVRLTQNIFSIGVLRCMGNSSLIDLVQCPLFLAAADSSMKVDRRRFFRESGTLTRTVPKICKMILNCLDILFIFNYFENKFYKF